MNRQFSMTITTDEKRPREWRDQAARLRGQILEQAEREPLPARFGARPCEDRPAVDICDTDTGRVVTVPLVEYAAARRVLNTLFGGES